MDLCEIKTSPSLSTIGNIYICPASNRLWILNHGQNFNSKSQILQVTSQNKQCKSTCQKNNKRKRKEEKEGFQHPHSTQATRQRQNEAVYEVLYFTNMIIKDWCFTLKRWGMPLSKSSRAVLSSPNLTNEKIISLRECPCIGCTEPP